MLRVSHLVRLLHTLLPGIVLLCAFYAASLWSFTLFHSLVELFSIALLFSIFLFGWNARAFLDSDYFLLLGLACLPMIAFEAIHMFGQPWMAVLPGGIETSTRALIAGRFVQAFALLLAIRFLTRRLRPHPTLFLLLTSTILLAGAVLFYPLQLCCTPDGVPTTFTIASHSITAAMMMGAMVLAHRSSHRFHHNVLSLMTMAIAFAALASIAFGLESFVAGPWFVLAHLSLALSFYLIYKALVETGFTRPYEILFHNLKQAEEHTRAMSYRDELTGLYNRRGFFSMAEQQVKLSKRTNHNMLLFYCDLDAMKTINDTLGHHEGDMALVDVANILRQTFRESDIIARIGGDEFVVLAIETSDTSVGTLRMRLEQNLIAFEERVGRPYSISLSSGVATYDPNLSESLEQVLSRADDLMYQQKQAHRKRPVS
ncbi:MAG: GGDEF domain-containing protein [Dehalococcoidia bacterium]|nr:GGDEF domain-containing protein [Dehalococcoidia bacterium]